MTKPRFILSLSLLTVILAACAPSAVTETSEPPAIVEPTATSPSLVEPTLESAAEAPVAAAPTALPVATSRGPDLHATDPSTVSLASGQLQFVEFFRFT